MDIIDSSCGKRKKHTYKEIHESLPGIPTNLLSNRLKELCQDDLLQCDYIQNILPVIDIV